MADPTNIIELKNVSKSFLDKRTGHALLAVKDLSLSIEDKRPRGEFVVLLGPSGCGKSTILSLISGLASPNAGEVWVKGNLVTGPDANSVTVPQAYTCFPWLTAIENVEFGLALGGVPKDERRRLAEEYMHKVNLGEFLHARRHELSGGMQQRVAIARTLVMKRPIVLMDEPFGALDAQTRSEMQQMLLDLWDETKNTVVFVTHDITEALLLADRVLVFSPRPATIQQNLDVQSVFPYERKPELVHHHDFIQLSEFLRNELKTLHAPVIAPSPRARGFMSGVMQSVRRIGNKLVQPSATTPPTTTPPTTTPPATTPPAAAAVVTAQTVASAAVGSLAGGQAPQAPVASVHPSPASPPQHPPSTGSGQPTVSGPPPGAPYAAGAPGKSGSLPHPAPQANLKSASGSAMGGGIVPGVGQGSAPQPKTPGFFGKLSGLFISSKSSPGLNKTAGGPK